MNQSTTDTPLRKARVDLFPGETCEDIARRFRDWMTAKRRKACGGTSIARYERGERVTNPAAQNMLLELADFYFTTAKGRNIRSQPYTADVLLEGMVTP